MTDKNSDIQEMDDIPNNLITVLYGPPGIGKTILSARLGTENLFLTTENSHVSLSNFPELRRKSKQKVIRTYDDATSTLSRVKKGEIETDHVVFDTYSGLCEIKLSEQLTKVDFNRKHRLVSSLEDYQLLKESMKPFIRGIVGLIEKGISVTFICHDRVPNPDDSVKGDRLIRPDPPFRTFEILNGVTNITAYMHMAKQDGNKLRAVLVESDGEYVAKSHIRMPSRRITDNQFVETVCNWKGIEYNGSL